MDLQGVNLAEICRTCKCVSSHMRFIFEEFENPHQSPRIDEMLMACASVQVVCGDGLPSLICQVCVEQLTRAFVFKCQCEKIDASLREYSKNVKVEIKEELQNFDFTESLNTLNNSLDEQQSTSKEDVQDGIPPLVTPMDNNQMLLTCPECAKSFMTLEDLGCHKSIHASDTYKCKLCDKEYSRLNHLYRHKQTHRRRKVYVCRICNKTQTRMENLKRHLVTHLREKPFSCKTCNRGFNRIKHLYNHIPRCKGDTVYPCDICNRLFGREDSLEVHKKMHDNQALPTIENLDNIENHYYQIDQDANVVFSDHSDVDDCFEPQVEVTESVDEENIKEEANISNLDEESNISETSAAVAVVNNYRDNDRSVDKVTNKNREVEEVEIQQEVKVENVIFEPVVKDDDDNVNIVNEVVGQDSGDDNTDSDYFSKKSISLKVKKGHNRPCKNPSTPSKPPKMKVPGRGCGRRSIKNIKKEENDEECSQFPCLACQEIFNTISELDKHARQKHEGLKVHRCSVCNKEFNRANHLKLHQKVHERQNDFECDICQKLFNRADHLAKHKVSKHGIGEKVMGEKKFECPLCHKGFAIEKYRDKHVNGHNGQKGYQCKVCEKSFLSKSHLNQHMKSHDEHSKKLLCSECGQRFIRKDYLNVHMRRHRGEKPFKCKYCGKGFPRSTDMMAHERCHTGEKTHLCTICGKGFGRSYNYTVHMRTHTGEKPYQCTDCEAAFAQASDFKAHVRRHTGERFQCELCTKSYLKGSMLKQHKRTVHGLSISGIRPLLSICKQENLGEPPPISETLPKPVVPENVN